MQISLETVTKPGGVFCSYKDGRLAGVITPRIEDHNFTGWEAKPEGGPHTQFFLDLNAAEYYILAFATEAENRRHRDA